MTAGEQALWAAMLIGLAGLWALVGFEFCQSRHGRGGGEATVVPEPPPALTALDRYLYEQAKPRPVAPGPNVRGDRPPAPDGRIPERVS